MYLIQYLGTSHKNIETMDSGIGRNTSYKSIGTVDSGIGREYDPSEFPIPPSFHLDLDLENSEPNRISDYRISPYTFEPDSKRKERMLPLRSDQKIDLLHIGSEHRDFLYNTWRARPLISFEKGQVFAFLETKSPAAIKNVWSTERCVQYAISTRTKTNPEFIEFLLIRSMESVADLLLWYDKTTDCIVFDDPFLIERNEVISATSSSLDPLLVEVRMVANYSFGRYAYASCKPLAVRFRSIAATSIGRISSTSMRTLEHLLDRDFMLARREKAMGKHHVGNLRKKRRSKLKMPLKRKTRSLSQTVDSDCSSTRSLSSAAPSTAKRARRKNVDGSP